MTITAATVCNIANLAADCIDKHRNATRRATVNFSQIAELTQELEGELRRRLGNALCDISVCTVVSAERIIEICHG